jgi:GH43 family beta-xylosidase
MDGKDIKGATYLDPIGTEWQIQGLEDFTGDGKADILWRNTRPGLVDTGSLYLWVMDGPKVVVGTGYANSQAGLEWQVQGLGDLDGDGKSDSVWRHVGPGPATGALFLWLMEGKTIKGATYLDPIGTEWQIQGLGDFSGDGKTDILWRNVRTGLADTGYLYVWVMDGPKVVGGTGYPNSQAGLEWQVQAP